VSVHWSRALLAAPRARTRIPLRTWTAILAAMIGIAWMFARDAAAFGGNSPVGMLIAFAVPLARHHLGHAATYPQVGVISSRRFLGGILSALACCRLRWPLQADTRDIALTPCWGFSSLACRACFWSVGAAPTRTRDRAAGAARSGLRHAVGMAGRRRKLLSNRNPRGGAIVLAALALNELAATPRRGNTKRYCMNAPSRGRTYNMR